MGKPISGSELWLISVLVLKSAQLIGLEKPAGQSDLTFEIRIRQVQVNVLTMLNSWRLGFPNLKHLRTLEMGQN